MERENIDNIPLSLSPDQENLNHVIYKQPFIILACKKGIYFGQIFLKI